MIGGNLPGTGILIVSGTGILLPGTGILTSPWYGDTLFSLVRGYFFASTGNLEKHRAFSDKGLGRTQQTPPPQ